MYEENFSIFFFLPKQFVKISLKNWIIEKKIFYLWTQNKQKLNHFRILMREKKKASDVPRYMNVCMSTYMLCTKHSKSIRKITNIKFDWIYEMRLNFLVIVGKFYRVNIVFFLKILSFFVVLLNNWMNELWHTYSRKFI